MNVAETIKVRQNEITAEIERLAAEQSRLNEALKIINIDIPAPSVISNDNEDVAAAAPDVAVKATKEALIKDAVKRGNKKPASIHNFIRKRHGIEVNIGSLRSTLTRLGKAGAIKHDASGWVTAH